MDNTQTPAPDVQIPAPDASAVSNLAQSNPPMPQGPSQEDTVNAVAQAPVASPTVAPQTRLGKILSAIAGIDSDKSQPPAGQPVTRPSGSQTLGAVLSTIGAGVAGAANQKGRPSFAGGMAGGAENELKQIAQNRQFKFQSAEDAARAATLTMQDKELQLRTQEQQDAHAKALRDQYDWEDDHGIEHTTIPNSGQAANDHLVAQTQANGGASVPAGTHLSADGKSILIPVDSPETKQGMLDDYKQVGPALGLPPLPPNSAYVPSKLQTMATYVRNGYDINGQHIPADQLPQRIASLDVQIKNLQDNGGSPHAITTLQNLQGIYKANLKAYNDEQVTAAQNKKQGEIQAENSPEGKALADQREQEQEALQTHKEQEDDARKYGYAFNPKTNEAFYVSKADADKQGLVNFEPQTPQTLSADRHDQRVLNDVALKSNIVRQAAAKLPDGSQAGVLLAKVLADNPNTTANSIVKEKAYSQLSTPEKQYVISVLSLRESAMGLNKVLTGTARSNETQLQALLNTLPGLEPDASSVNAKLDQFNANMTQLRAGIPASLPGMPQVPLSGQPSSNQPQGKPNAALIQKYAGQ